MSIFASKCAQCGSTEHASNDCPHGILSGNKCAQCGSTEHASNDCPHGILSGNKCAQCGSTEHASNDCPHGILSGNKCAQCGSTEHASHDCPHGILSGNKCAQCGSTEHASNDCPHRYSLSAQENRIHHEEEISEENASNERMPFFQVLAQQGGKIGFIIGLLIGIIAAIGNAPGLVMGGVIIVASTLFFGFAGALLGQFMPFILVGAIIMLIVKACGA
ncbi:MAG: hypothetical protein R3C97_00485 [Geminicoccaceae bacterium]